MKVLLKLEGAKEDVRKFLLEALTPIPNGFFEQTPAEKIVEEDEYEIFIKSENAFHIKGTRRNFIESNIQHYFEDDEDKLEICVLEDYKAAWGIDASTISNLV
ncbi:hypothetical protein ACT7C9_25030 [Bacillus cereus]